MKEIIVTSAQMQEADRRTIAAGTPGIVLMERAGAGVAEIIRAHYPTGRALVLCGPGNNGGDGYVIARLLRESGWAVTLVPVLPEILPKGDAALARQAWLDAGGVESVWDSEVLKDARVIVDAMFGTGLARPVAGEMAEMISAVNEAGVPVVAVDIPSGLCSDTGAVLGIAIQAARTVTFAAKKHGQLTGAGPRLCGMLDVVDIGITQETLEAVGHDA